MSINLHEYRKIAHSGLHKHPWNQLFTKAEQKLGVNRVNIFDGLLAFAGLCLLFGFAPQFISYVIGLIYPVYKTMVAIELSKNAEYKQWLSYWIIFACLTLVDCVAAPILPTYWLMKSIFLILCYFPSEENVSLVVYNHYFRPFYMKYIHLEPLTQDEIDNMMLVTKEIKKIKELQAAGMKSLSFEGPKMQQHKWPFNFRFKSD